MHFLWFLDAFSETNFTATVASQVEQHLYAKHLKTSLKKCLQRTLQESLKEHRETKENKRREEKAME